MVCEGSEVWCARVVKSVVSEGNELPSHTTLHSLSSIRN